MVIKRNGGPHEATNRIRVWPVGCQPCLKTVVQTTTTQSLPVLPVCPTCHRSFHKPGMSGGNTKGTKSVTVTVTVTVGTRQQRETGRAW